MEELREWRGLPGAIRCDNEPELTSQSFVDWCGDHRVEILYIQPGKPVQNAYIERFNRTFRKEVLDAYLFEDLEQAQDMTNECIRVYNEQRPHESLGGLPPSVFREKVTSKSSTLELSTYNGKLTSPVNPERLCRILSKMADEREYLSPYGIRSLSRLHERIPDTSSTFKTWSTGLITYRQNRTPACLGGNSN
jgi:putative transposase